MFSQARDNVGKTFVRTVEEGFDDFGSTDMVKAGAMLGGYVFRLPTRWFVRGYNYLDEEGTGDLDTFEGWWRMTVMGPEK